MTNTAIPAAAEELLAFIQCSTSPFHVVEESAKRLLHAGFQELKPADSWRLAAGGRYFLRVYGSTLLAFVVGEKPLKSHGTPLLMAAAHTDFPCFRLKPEAGMTRDGCGTLNVETYGGLILRTWLDRPLSLAGKIVLRGKDAFHPEVRLVDFQKPLMTIPSLAIHMDRDVNKDGALNAQKDMLPLAALLGKDAEEDFFLAWLAEACETERDAILSYDLGAYPCEAGCTFGLRDEFISSPRLDNLTSVLACLKGIEEAHPTQGIRLIALFDNEEVGSRTKQGAGSAVAKATPSAVRSPTDFCSPSTWRTPSILRTRRKAIPSCVPRSQQASSSSRRRRRATRETPKPPPSCAHLPKSMRFPGRGS